jgi:hypothetical protein
VVKIVVSGTGLSLEEVEDDLTSSVGKPLGRFETFVELGMLDDPPETGATLRTVYSVVYIGIRLGQKSSTPNPGIPSGSVSHIFLVTYGV